MNYKCPFCHSDNTEEITKPFGRVSNSWQNPYSVMQDTNIEYVCLDCGQISKINPIYYKDGSCIKQEESERK